MAWCRSRGAQGSAAKLARLLRSPARTRGISACASPRPQAQRDVRHGEVVAEVQVERVQHAARLGSRPAGRRERCTFSPMASFSSPNWISSRSLPSSCFAFSRSVRIWRSLIGIARPPCGMGNRRFSEHLGVVLEKLGCSFRNPAPRRLHDSPSLVPRCSRLGFLRWPELDLDLAFEHATAGPVIITGAPSPAHDIPRSPPRVATVTSRRAARA